MILDVGCGPAPKGHVNVDRYVGETPHLDHWGNYIDPHKIPNFIQADIHWLPFPDNSFRKVNCRAVLEHKGVHFERALRELCRVAEEEVEFLVPHRYAWKRCFPRKMPPMHDKIFNAKLLRKWLKTHSYPAHQIRIEYKPFPSQYIPLVQVPWYIIVTVRK